MKQIEKTCRICRNIFLASTLQTKAKYCPECRIKGYNPVKERQEIKVKLILIKDGKCKKCGYSYNGKNAAVFHFHHRNPDTKEFNIAPSKLNSDKLNNLCEEIQKCDLLCANCHILVHLINEY